VWSAGPVFVIAVPTPRPSMRSLLVAAVRTPRAADHLCTVTEAQAETGATRLWRSLCRRFHSTRLRISAVATCGIFGQSLLECRQFEVEGIPPSCHSQEPPAMQVARNGGRRPSLPEWRQRVASRQSPLVHTAPETASAAKINAQAPCLGACPLWADDQHHATPFGNSRRGSLAGFGVGSVLGCGGSPGGSCSGLVGGSFAGGSGGSCKGFGFLATKTFLLCFRDQDQFLAERTVPELRWCKW